MFDSDDNDFCVLDEVLIDDFLGSTRKDDINKTHFNESAISNNSKSFIVEKFLDSSFQEVDGPEHGRNPKPSLPNFSCSKSRRRKFPGPAGILPERRNSHLVAVNNDLTEESDTSSLEVSSQEVASQSMLEDEPWQRLSAELDSNPPGRKVLECLNIAIIKRKANARMLSGHKIPFLACVVHSVHSSTPDPYLTLRDSTGEIGGTLHRDVWQQFGNDIIVGSALMLINVGVLSVGISPRRHYLNITGNNVAAIYSLTQGDVQRKTFKYLTSRDFIKTIDDWSKSNVHSPQPSGTCSTRSPLFTFSPKISGLAATPPSLFSSPKTSSTTPIRNHQNYRNREAISDLVCGRRNDLGNNSSSSNTGQAKENNCNNRIVPTFAPTKLSNRLGPAPFKKPVSQITPKKNNSIISNSHINSNFNASNPNTSQSNSKSLFQPKNSRNALDLFSPASTTLVRNTCNSTLNFKNDLEFRNEFEPVNKTVIKNGEKRLLVESNSTSGAQNGSGLSNIRSNFNVSCVSLVSNTELESDFEISQVEDVLDGLDADSLFGDFD